MREDGRGGQGRMKTERRRIKRQKEDGREHVHTYGRPSLGASYPPRGACNRDFDQSWTTP